jgi:hypothetical protein
MFFAVILLLHERRPKLTVLRVIRSTRRIPIDELTDAERVASASWRKTGDGIIVEDKDENGSGGERGD